MQTNNSSVPMPVAARFAIAIALALAPFALIGWCCHRAETMMRDAGEVPRQEVSESEARRIFLSGDGYTWSQATSGERFAVAEYCATTRGGHSSFYLVELTKFYASTRQLDTKIRHAASGFAAAGSAY